jgi:hypothetical protein
VHFGYDNWQGQWLGLSVAAAIIQGGTDPAAKGVLPRESQVSLENLARTLSSRSDLYGYYGHGAHRDRDQHDDE